MNAFTAPVERLIIPVPAKDVGVWTDANGKHPARIAKSQTNTFLLVNWDTNPLYPAPIKYRLLTPDIAVRERAGTRTLPTTPHLLEQDILLPKWRDDVLRRTRLTIPAHVHIRHSFQTSHWKQTRIAYYGVRIAEIHNVSVLKVWTSIHVNVNPTVVYSHVKTAECPHAIPFVGTKASDLLHVSRDSASDELEALIAEERRRQRTDDPDIASHFALRTTLWVEEKTYVWRPRAEGKRAKTIQSLQDRYPPASRPEPLIPLTFLADVSTKADAKPINVEDGVHVGAWAGNRRRGRAAEALEALRQFRGELKRLLAEAVYHPDRIDRMATAHGVDFQTYLLALSGEKD